MQKWLTSLFLSILMTLLAMTSTVFCAEKSASELLAEAKLEKLRILDAASKSGRPLTVSSVVRLLDEKKRKELLAEFPRKVNKDMFLACTVTEEISKVCDQQAINDATKTLPLALMKIIFEYFGPFIFAGNIEHEYLIDFSHKEFRRHPNLPGDNPSDFKYPVSISHLQFTTPNQINIKRITSSLCSICIPINQSLPCQVSGKKRSLQDVPAGWMSNVPSQAPQVENELFHADVRDFVLPQGGTKVRIRTKDPMYSMIHDIWGLKLKVTQKERNQRLESKLLAKSMVEDTKLKIWRTPADA